MITRPVRERSIDDASARWSRTGSRRPGFEEVGLLSLSSADHTEIAEVAKGLADRYEGTNVSLSLPSTRVDAFNIDLANELSRNGRRSGLTFAPEGGSERMRKVINKMVTEEDLIRTVADGVLHGWRQVKLYFMCGLPDRDRRGRAADRRPGQEGDRTGREVTGRNDIRCTVSIGGFVPKPHTPFQWAAQLDHETTDARLAKLRDAVRADKRYGRAIGFRYHDGKPGIIEGLLSRGDRRVGAVIEGLARRRPVRRLERALLLRPLDALRRGGARRTSRSTSTGTPPASASTTRCCPGTTSTPASTRTGCGRTGRTRSSGGRGRGLPLDAVLRLRRLPADGHRDPDRPHRPDAAAADGGAVVVGRARGRQLGNVTSPTTTGEAPVGTVATCSGPSSRPHSWLLAVGQ